MSNEHIYKHLISSLYKMLCWREENKRWQTIYDEFLGEVSLGTFEDDFKASVLYDYGFAYSDSVKTFNAKG